MLPEDGKAARKLQKPPETRLTTRVQIKDTQKPGNQWQATGQGFSLGIKIQWIQCLEMPWAHGHDRAMVMPW